MTTEPLKDYEERRTAVAKDGKDAHDPKSTSATPEPKDAKDNQKGGREDGSRDEAADKENYGMMAGVIPGAAKKEDQQKLLPVTPWGRYLKILFSSNEFLFIN
jgi:hypothetical protein